ncbi:MAG TPA: PLP-dependent aminotransferase family protein, partial [Candidatus Faecousia faecipullorum]|nr:PLP-dependent aminotransferase family protein [Candidatus Faecousia faecipullorum]
LRRRGVRVRALSEYYHDASGDRQTLVVNYASLKEEDLQKALEVLGEILENRE